MTGIQWTNETLNPTTGCDRVSDGCTNCYALTMAKRLKGMGQAKYQRDGDPRTSGPGFGLTMHPDTLHIPLSWRKPRRCFVNSMSDLFHPEVETEFIARMWAVMAATPQHTYQILSKRHARMRSLLRDDCRCGAGHAPGVHFRSKMEWASTPHSPTYVPGLRPDVFRDMTWPLPNVHLGASVEDQETANLRVPALVETPAAVRFLSLEPLLAPVDLSVIRTRNGTLPVSPLEMHYDQDTGVGQHPISWLIIGGESGPGARPMQIEWARSLVKQAHETGIACFVKQLGSRWDANHGRRGNGGDISQWPEDLRIREFPLPATAVTS